MAVIIPIAGGKGGVGKSVLSLNLSIAVSALCKQVILCDFDLGGANLHTLLGLKNNQAGLGNYIHRQETQLENLIQATGIPDLHFIAGDCLFPGVANMEYFIKKKLIKDLSALPADYIVLDLGAGSTYNILDFWLLTYDGILVVTPEITSILNAYSFIKSAIFRFFYRLFPAKSPERQILQNSVLQRMEGKEYSFLKILEVIKSHFPESGQYALDQLEKFRPRVIMNMGRCERDAEMGMRLRTLVRNKLAVTIEYIGFVPFDEVVQYSIAGRQPVYLQYPQSSFSSVVAPIAR
ncbi:MAG: P-loop NTPase, partial [Spirochaetaceae bacterium]|nr:P-loop NTPase [Spirochaetaceae bacterium]